MKFITAANKDMKKYVDDCTNSLESFGYDYQVYDLGGLKRGIDFTVTDTDLYLELPPVEEDMNSKRISKSLFKPKVIKDARTRFPTDTLVWIDADTVLKKEFIIDGNFDIGVAQRPQSELWMETSGMFDSQDRIGRYNAGMIIFNPTDKSDAFINLWKNFTVEIKNDQIALNKTIKKHIADVKIFPVRYNSPKDNSETVLYHIKGKKK